jgi:type 1 fimbria pilin
MMVNKFKKMFSIFVLFISGVSFSAAANIGSGQISFRGYIVDNAAAAVKKCLSEAIHQGISQRCSGEQGTSVRSTVKHIMVATIDHQGESREQVKVRKVLLNFD